MVLESVYFKTPVFHAKLTSNHLENYIYCYLSYLIQKSDRILKIRHLFFSRGKKNKPKVKAFFLKRTSSELFLKRHKFRTGENPNFDTWVRSPSPHLPKQFRSDILPPGSGRRRSKSGDSPNSSKKQWAWTLWCVLKKIHGNKTRFHNHRQLFFCNYIGSNNRA